jgi:histidine phosphotransferase ChpT
MTHPVDLRIVELLAARLCHDLVGPVAAIGNGIELMADEEPDFVREAVALVGDSAVRANARLQFYRFAYGFRGTGLAGAPPHRLVADYFAGSNVTCDYGPAAQALDLYEQKLACVMLTVGGEGLARGGRLVVIPGAAGPEIDATGEGVGPSAEIRDALVLAVSPADLTSRTVGGYFAGLLADRLGSRITIIDRPGGFRLNTVRL